MTNHAVSNRADLRERTKKMSRHGDRRGQIVDFRDSFETINWLYLLFKCGIKTKTHFEWLLWHWSSLGQLNLEPTRPNGLVGCKVPTDLVKISVKEATHMGFHYKTPHSSLRRARGVFCKFFLENWPCYNGTTLYMEFILVRSLWLVTIISYPCLSFRITIPVKVILDISGSPIESDELIWRREMF